MRTDRAPRHVDPTRREALLEAFLAAVVAGDPEEGMIEKPLILLLSGEDGPFTLRRPIPVRLLMEALIAPAVDLDLEVRLAIDGGPLQTTDERLFLAAGVPGQDAVSFDLRFWAERLEPSMMNMPRALKPQRCR